MRNHKSYTDQDKGTAIALLDSNAGNITRTSAETGIPATTLRQWRDGKGISASALADSDLKGEDIGNLYEKVTRTYLKQSLTPKIIRATKGKDAIFAAAIATDKMHLVRGLPTSISGSVMSDDERRLKVAELLTRIAERQNTPESDPA